MPTVAMSVIKRLGHSAAYALYSNLLSKRTFTFNGSRHRFFYHRYNSTCETERCIEIPIALSFLRDLPATSTLEVGNVLNHYVPFGHTVVDKYEVGTGVINVDICDFEPVEKYAAIVSISTFEHVGWDEEPFDSEKAFHAIKRLRNMLLPNGRILVSFPIGHHSALDRAIRDESLGCCEVRGMKRVGINGWVEVSVQELFADRLDPSYRRGGGSYRRVRAVVFAYFGPNESCEGVMRHSSEVCL
jgi:hypothetical protein